MGGDHGQQAQRELELLRVEIPDEGIQPGLRLGAVVLTERESLVRRDGQDMADPDEGAEVRLPDAVDVVGVPGLGQPEASGHLRIREAEFPRAGLQALS